ncbi:histone-like nucleoid-structuring protein Lsr2 [Streptomyces sp. NPDC059567]
MRAWDRAQGYDVPDRGRVPSEILDAWEQAEGERS